MRKLSLLLPLLSILFCMPSTNAQVPDPTIAARAPVPGVGHDYIGMGAETVNPADGSLSFNLPLNPPPGRQLSLPFGIRYSSSEQFYVPSAQSSKFAAWSNVSPAPFQLRGWAYLIPSYSAQEAVQLGANTFQIFSAISSRVSAASFDGMGI